MKTLSFFQNPLNDSIISAIKADDIRKLERALIRNPTRLNLNHLDIAVTASSLRCLRYLCEVKHIQPDADTLFTAALKARRLSVIQYLVEECGIQPTRDTVDATIMGDNHQANRYLSSLLYPDYPSNEMRFK